MQNQYGKKNNLKNTGILEVYEAQITFSRSARSVFFLDPFLGATVWAVPSRQDEAEEAAEGHGFGPGDDGHGGQQHVHHQQGLGRGGAAAALRNDMLIHKDVSKNDRKRIRKHGTTKLLGLFGNIYAYFMGFTIKKQAGSCCFPINQHLESNKCLLNTTKTC